MRRQHTALYLAIAALFACGHAAAADSQSAQQANANGPGNTKEKNVKQLSAVEVTATKRSMPLQKTPIAISVIDTDTLDKQRVMTVQDITSLVPGFAATTEGDHDVITMTMRGIGNDSAKTEYADPEVALFVDGVYEPRAETAAGLLLDIDNVQVMRGPQGTLWGRNSTAGAVNFVTAKPEIGYFFGHAEFEAGNYGHFGTRGMVNIPVSDTFAVRVAVAQEQHDGYVDYQNAAGELPSLSQQQAAYLASGGTLASFQAINPNLYLSSNGQQKYNAQDQSAARVSARWKPSDDFLWDLSFEYFRDRGTPNMDLMQNPRPGQEFWSALIDTAPYLKRDSYTLRSHMQWNLSDAVELDYIAGFNRYSGKSDFDQDAGAILPTSFTTGGSDQEDRTNSSNYKSFSSEFDLKSRGDQTIDWILGLYYDAENNNIRFDIPILNGTQQGTIAWQGSFIQPKETVNSDAVFGQATWNVNDQLHLTAGARYSHDTKKNVDGRGWGWAYDPTVPQVPIAPGVQPGPATGFAVSTYNDAKYSKGEVTWLGRVDYDLTEHTMVYASVSTGYKAGGTEDGGTLYKPEKLTNYEIGSKMSFLDGHLTWNNALYYEDFKDFQLSAPITYPNGNHGLGFSNVEGSTKVEGFESELAYQSRDDRANLVFSAIPKKKLGTLLYAGSNDYAGLPACPPASNISNCMDITGNDLPHAPDTALTAIYEHDFHLANGGRLTPRISAHYESSSWLSPFNLGTGDQQGAYTRGDVSLRYEEPNDRWYATVYVQNVTDEKVRTNARRAQKANGDFVYLSQYLPPRTFGVNVGFDF